jgi:phospholipid transport system substrate-binding protein
VTAVNGGWISVGSPRGCSTSTRWLGARHWKDRSAQEQEEFIRLFTDLLELSYLTTIENYAGEKITFLGESVSSPYAQVRSRITTHRRVEISIEYRLLESDARWAVYDWCWTG